MFPIISRLSLKINRYCDKRIENVWITKDSRNIHDPWTRIVNNWASYIRIACVIVLEILHHLAGVPMWSGWSRERVGSWQRRHSSAEDGQRVHPGQQLLVYGRHAYATGQRPQPQGKRVITSPAANYLNKWCASKLTMFGNSLDICRNSVNIYVYREKIVKYILQILWFLHENNLMIISKINEWKYSEWLIVKIRINEYIIYFSFLSHWFASYINIINKFNHILNKILQKFWMIHL